MTSPGGSAAAVPANVVGEQQLGSAQKKWNRSHGQRGSGKAQKFNANHLLSFQYEDLDHRVRQSNRSSAPSGGGAGTGGGRVDAQAAKKAYILQSFQFVLCEAAAIDPAIAARCAPALLNFDELPPWDFVSFVLCRDSPEEHVCPVCLDVPQAPRITNCGHIFCYPCLLRHLDYLKQRGQPRSCPVCHTIVVKPTLRPVLWSPCTDHFPGRKVTMTFLSRNKDTCQLRQPSLLAQGGFGDVAEGSCGQNTTPPMHPTDTILNFIRKHVPPYGDHSATYARFSLATESLVEMVKATDSADLHERLEGIPMAPPSASEEGASTTTTSGGKDGARGVTSPPPPAGPPGSGLVGAPAVAAPIPEVSDTHDVEEILSHNLERKFCEECLLWVSGRHPNANRGFSSYPGAASSTGKGQSAGSQLERSPPSGPAAAPAQGLIHSQTSSLTAAIKKLEQSGGGTGGSAKLVNVYRAADGQQMYLHFLNMRMLRDAFLPPTTGTAGGTGDSPGAGGGAGASSVDLNLPAQFDATIEDVETVTQTTTTRNSFKPIAHIPLHSTFKMCFMDLTDVVPAWVMDKYKSQIDSRRERIRAVQERDEETAARCLTEAWMQYKEGQQRSGSTTFTPEISPEMLAQMPSLEEVLPNLDLGPSVVDGEEEDDDVAAVAREGATMGDDDDDEQQRGGRGGGDGYQTPPSEDTPTYPAQWAPNSPGALRASYVSSAAGMAPGDSWRTAGGSSSSSMLVIGSSSTIAGRPPKETRQERQLRKDRDDAISSLFGRSNTTDSETGDVGSAGGQTTGGGKKGKGKGKAKGKTISLTGGGRT